jgi:hypothetical protein
MSEGGFVFLVLLVILAWVISAVVKSNVTKNKKAKYDAALARGDKSAALSLGREYYASMRSDRKLTIYDEQAIANDISTMK